MRLLWIRYISKQQSRYALFLVIGDEGGNLITLKSKSMAPGDIIKVRTAMKHLESVTVSQRTEWIKKYCPESYRKAFRKLPAGKYKIISQH